jgi:nucleotide-binding universal stress UspA family protein
MTQPKPFLILVALDVAGDSPGVLSHALELARGHENTELHVLAVAQVFSGVAVPPAIELAVDAVKDCLERLRAFATVQLTEAVARAPFAEGRAPRVQIHATVGTPAAEIVWLSAHLDADLVVVGTHSRKGLKRMLLGSVSERVTRLAGCPVLVVREKQHVAPWRIPEIEPICGDCAAARSKSEGRDLWCARHAEHHVRAHIVSHGPHGRGPSPIESMTGT